MPSAKEMGVFPVAVPRKGGIRRFTTLLVDSLKIEEREEACPWKCPVRSREEDVFPYAVPIVRVDTLAIVPA